MDTQDQKTFDSAFQAEELAEAIRKAGSSGPSGDGTGGPGSNGPDAAQSRTYAPEEVAALVTLPAEALYALTGWEGWIIDDREKKILAEKTAQALSLFMQIEPKWFVGMSFAATIAAIYGTRTIAYMKERKERGEDSKISKV